MEGKKELRDRCRAAAVPRPEASAALCSRILQLEAYQNAVSVLAYCPMRAEPDIRPVLEDCLRSGRSLYLPQTDDAMRIHPRRVMALNQLRRGRFGIWEPPEDAPEARDFSLILVPALAYDRQLYRLGQGAGCYDRFLPESTGVTLGVCFDAFLLDWVPRDPHDQAVQMLCTESQTIVK